MFAARQVASFRAAHRELKFGHAAEFPDSSIRMPEIGRWQLMARWLTRRGFISSVRQQEPALPSGAVGKAAAADGVERPHQIGEPERSERDQERQGRIAGGEEYRSDRYRKEAVNDEVKPFEDIVNRRGDDQTIQRGRLCRGRDGPTRRIALCLSARFDLLAL
jgi:hypothetical protein